MKPKTNYKPGPMDNCQTPVYALEPLQNLFHKNYRIYDPARGEGNLIRGLRHYGYEDVVGTDISMGIDFFTDDLGANWDVQITNPPYGLKYRWLKRSFELQKPFALLVPVEMLGAKRCQDELKKHNDITILLLNQRVNFKMPNKGWDSAAQFPVMWLIWNPSPPNVFPVPIIKFADINNKGIKEIAPNIPNTIQTALDNKKNEANRPD